MTVADGPKQLTSTETAIPGLTLWDLPVHGDSRGWFKENWQREKMTALGLPDFGPVQNNISFNATVGTTRGIHAEPWDKWVSVATGRIFGAWVDLREGPTFGAVVTAEIDPSRAVFVPRGVGNAFQTLEEGTAYSYLVNAHWSPDAEYALLNLADETVAVPWPIPLDQAEVSDKDKGHPRLDAITPVRQRRTVIIGSKGQLGRALEAELAHDHVLDLVDREELDISSPTLATDYPWHEVNVILNAAAYTAVDVAETPEGRADAWAANASAPAALARIAAEHRITLVHVSSDYVFDGSSTMPYTEGEPFAPLGVYGQSKAAGDIAVAGAPKHYIVRTSWVIGDGKNFVRTMAGLAGRGVAPSVVDDQVGRLTFTADLARGIRHLVETAAPYGTYNLTGSGEPASWATVASEVYDLVAAGSVPGVTAVDGIAGSSVTPVSTVEYFASATVPVAPRPANSVLDMAKIEATGFIARDWRDSLQAYLLAE
ncbi:sugar nucleotide-binding protein [Demequina capsici]|uniref:sugar nucleotide-binding protein n=1 Tax=Demequina capsici TaxID=3075620 RepID=UPI003F68AF52